MATRRLCGQAIGGSRARITSRATRVSSGCRCILMATAALASSSGSTSFRCRSARDGVVSLDRVCSGARRPSSDVCGVVVIE
eukprot:320045-Prymnesium_polylepis.3